MKMKKNMVLMLALTVIAVLALGSMSACKDNCNNEENRGNWRLFDTSGQDTSAAVSNSSNQNADSRLPSNVEVQLKSIETDETDRSWLVTEVSWDANSSIDENELYAYLIDSSGNKYDIPRRSAFTIGNKDGFPDDFRYKTKNGRNYITLKVPILKSGETKLESNSEGTAANGINVGDKFGVTLTSCYKSGDKWNETEGSKPVVVEFTEANVNQQKTFK